MTIAYTTGQITLTNGSAVITGVGTGWEVALISGGFVSPEATGNILPIESVDSDTQITSSTKWTGASGTYNYALTRDTAYLQQLSVNSDALARLIAELDAGTIWKFDVAGSMADRSIYDERPKGFAYLVIDEAPAELYIKASATSGAWAGPYRYAQGEQGPMGPAGYVNPRGTYSGATAYLRNDGVLYNGSSFVALQATTGNAPPTFPTTSNAYWQLTAIKGTDGAGTGDVTGPAGVTDGNVAVFDGTTGKLIKQLTKAQFKTWLATTALDVSFDNSTANLSGSPANVQAAINALAANTGGGKNDAVFAIEIADLKGQRMGMVGGVADSFDDETGIATKTNATYDAANDTYYPTTTTDQTSAATPSSSVSSATYTVFNYALPITNGKTVIAFTFNVNVAGAYTIKIAQRTGAGAYTIVYSQAVTHGGGGLQTFTLTTPYTVPGSGTFVLGAYTAVATAMLSVPGVTRSYKAGDLTGAQTGFTDDTATAYSIGAIYSYTPDNMTLVSATYTATAVPTTARIALQLADSLSLTPGTDFTMEVSRDNGTTWTAVTLTLTVALFGGVKMYEGTATISAQPSGTSMKWRFKTLTNKNIIASGVVLQQS